MSIRPNCASASSARARTSAGSATSVGTATAVPPSVRIFGQLDGTSGAPVGRLVEPDEGYGFDAEPDSVAYDAGAAGGGASAEELAVHETPDPGYH